MKIISSVLHDQLAVLGNIFKWNKYRQKLTVVDTKKYPSKKKKWQEEQTAVIEPKKKVNIL